MKTLSERLAYALKERGKSPAELARATGKTESAVSQWLSGETKSMRSDSLMSTCGLLGCSAQWLASGKGDPGWEIATELTSILPGPATIDLVNNPDYPAVRRVNIKLSAGASGFGVDYIEDDEAPIVFQRRWFDHHGYNPAKLLAVRVANGSMEPGLYDGDTVIVNTADTNLKDGIVFAMNYEGELVIKRLVRDAGEWWLSSDNPDQRRYPRKVCTEHVFCIGRIVHRQSERI